MYICIYILGSQVVKYRKPIPAFATYIIELQVVYYDEKWLYIMHHFKSRKGQLYTQLLTRQIIKGLFIILYLFIIFVFHGSILIVFSIFFIYL